MQVSIFSQGNTDYAAGWNYLCVRTYKAACGLLYGWQDAFTDHVVAHDFRHQHVDGFVEIDTDCKIGRVLCDDSERGRLSHYSR